jgi:hypothetical protein
MPAPMVTFTRRTNNPKLAWLHDLLIRHGIPCKIEGESFHAPILRVSELFEDYAWALLTAPAKDYGIRTKNGTNLDDVRDEHPFFQRWAEKEDYYSEKAWPHIEDYE